ncbi:MAG: DcaP family trimeric outer membrane transporter [Pseudomonadota bacterium]
MTVEHLAARLALAAALAACPSLAAAATNAELEARVRDLEAALMAVKAELAHQREPAPAAATTAAAAPIATLPVRTAALMPAPAPMPSAPSFRFGGFVKLDAMVSDFQRGDPPAGDLVRDFYLPGAIPTAGDGEGRKVDLSARQTRLWMAANSKVGGHTVHAKIEGDFQTLPGTTDARTTNPVNFALRRAYVSVDGWLFGQDWSTFQNVAVLPETADYLGPTEGTVFVRQAQVRYTRGAFSVALENPESTVTPLGGGARIVADDNALPDLVARMDVKRPFGEFALAGLARRLSVEQGPLKDSAIGWGVSASGRLKVGERDDIRFMATTGEGIGRYVGLNFANDAAVDATGQLEAIPVTAGFVSYRHAWTDVIRSTVTWSAQVVDNPAAAGPAANHAAYSAHANLVWTPLSGFDVGVEYMYGRRELESGVSGDLDRLQGFARYLF